MAKPALGRGLDALLSGALKPIPQRTGEEKIEIVSIDNIRPSPFQPRQDFPEEEIKELAASISQKGLLQPIILRRREDHFEIVAGERRWRAAKLAGLTQIPALIKEVDDATALEMALVENLQREDLNPIEEAQAYNMLIEKFGLRQEDVAERVGKSRATIANALRLLQLPEQIKEALRLGKLSAGHAKAILAIEDVRLQIKVAEYVIEKGLSVRETESYVASLLRNLQPQQITKEKEQNLSIEIALLRNICDKLQEKLGTRINLRYRKGKGKLEIYFFNQADLDRILELLGIKLD